MDLKVLKLTPRRQELLKRMNIHTLEQLLNTYPLRYESIQAVSAQEWNAGDHVAFEGLILNPASVIRLNKNRTMTRFKVFSQDQELQITLFNRPWPGQFVPGKNITLFGVYEGKGKVVASSYNFHPLAQQQGLKPVYSVSGQMKQSDMKAIMEKALPCSGMLEDRVPERYRKKYRLLSKSQSLRWIHNPPDEKALHQAIRTLKYEEFLCFQCVLQASGTQRVFKEPKRFDRNKVEEKVKSLPYALTADQRAALMDILDDMHKDVQMYRMVQGDVGCGKTVVAAMSLYACALSGMQAAFLAPTEILAKQHLINLQKLGVEARLLSSSLNTAQKREVLQQLEDGSLTVVVGTHALFQEKVKFRNLGLVVADEQQRFGVRQRRSLLEKGSNVDFLMMTATPIPRTYAHFLFGDIALSSIHTLPPGRRPVKTRFVEGNSMGPVLKDILEGIAAGRQVYVVCPAIEDNPETDIKAAENIYNGMVRILKDTVHIGLLHGKMSGEQKEAVMDSFAKGELEILISTTVIEVGIDVPRATMMVIYDAHRFGLSTLHQLRGRAARGSVQGECFLLSGTKDPQAKERLRQLETLLDGFSVSRYDLQQRGPGDLLGTRQAGLPSFILGDFEKDPAIMEVCVQDAREILGTGLDEPMLRYVRQALENARYMD